MWELVSEGQVHVPHASTSIETISLYLHLSLESTRATVLSINVSMSDRDEKQQIGH